MTTELIERARVLVAERADHTEFPGVSITALADLVPELLTALEDEGRVSSALRQYAIGTITNESRWWTRKGDGTVVVVDTSLVQMASYAGDTIALMVVDRDNVWRIFDATPEDFDTLVAMLKARPE